MTRLIFFSHLMQIVTLCFKIKWFNLSSKVVYWMNCWPPGGKKRLLASSSFYCNRKAGVHKYFYLNSQHVYGSRHIVQNTFVSCGNEGCRRHWLKKKGSPKSSLMHGDKNVINNPLVNRKKKFYFLPPHIKIGAKKPICWGLLCLFPIHVFINFQIWVTRRKGGEYLIWTKKADN